MDSPGVRAVSSNQSGPYEHLQEVVGKYATTQYLRPIANHTQTAFGEAVLFVERFYSEHCKNQSCTSKAIILDSGCGTGDSTLSLARKFKDIPVIGIDKSARRLNKAENKSEWSLSTIEQKVVPENVFWVRAELLDFWRLALDKVLDGSWTITHHALYYPNPWPKQSEATRRFHLHPIFKTMMSLSNVTEIRTHWEIYAQEFCMAARILDNDAECSLCEYKPTTPETAFEKKYSEAGQALWQVVTRRNLPR